MKARILIAFLCASLILPLAVQAGEGRQERKEANKAYRKQQQNENKAFRETLKSIPEEQRQSAVFEHRDSQFAENVARHEQMHTENMARIKEKLSANTQLTEAQKQEILTKAENSYQEKVAQAKERHIANMNFAQQVANDASLSPEQKREKLQEYMKNNREEMKEKHSEEKQEREMRREEFRNKRQENRMDKNKT